MKNVLSVLFLSILSFINSQIINLDTYSSVKNSEVFNTAIIDLKKKYSSKKQHVTLLIPAGRYEISQPIILNKYISLEGESANSTILHVTRSDMEAIILEENRNDSDIYNGYNSIKNLTITGPDFGKNFFAWKDNKRNNPKSIGIKILGLRNRIENCTIDGFLWSGIHITGSYYNFMTNNFIKNNRIGIIIENTSTSTYVNNNEIRDNGSGILINNNSYANFINNNMIENNITNFLDTEIGGENLYSRGNGIIINKSMNNFIQNNYFEQQFNNILLSNATDNEVSSNFFALGFVEKKWQNVIKLEGKSENNSIVQNKTMGTDQSIDLTRINFDRINNFSSNIIDFGEAKNKQLKSKADMKANSKSPQIK
ncbi:right-handed parallel beta-helix repeat-containing protein [Chryseobacterium sp. MP_3.2]|uniref:right-handed parallel beta-helix repeat-containing protein n=1 Tax=Chryseobacterium sp. MP_3.2 TaxID=3071712 RepID=UPI002E0885D3|nr:parallel beta-helix repeat protein [Chryseobacterium sp. MP_3.2]